MTFETEPVEIDITILAETPDALLVDDSDVEVWIPKSQISNYDSDWAINDMVKIEIPEWLATDRGLV